MTKLSDLPRNYQVSHIETRGNAKRLEALTRNTTPSWKRFGDGANFIGIDFRLPCELNIVASETSYGEKSNTTKEVHLSLNPETSRKIYELLKEHFEAN